MEGQRPEKRLEPFLVRVGNKWQLTQDIHITKNEFKIGRSLENDFVIRNICISNQHCIFRLTHGKWSITHCSSENPILINDNAISKGNSYILQMGDIIQLTPEFKYVFALNVKFDQTSKKPRLEGRLFDKFNKRNTTLQEELNRLRKEKEMSQEISKKISYAIATFEHLDKLEEEKHKFEERLTEEKRKWEEALEASKQEKETLEITMKEQMEEWKTKKQEEWKTKMESLVLEEKNMQEILLNEKTLLEQRLKEMENTLKLNENIIQRIFPEKIMETSDSIFPRPSFIEQTHNAIFDKVENIMSEQLACSICSEIFVRAMTMNCMHVFCQHCIMTWVTETKEPICPVCRARVVSMTRSLVIDNFIERMVENLPPASRIRRIKLVKERTDLAMET